MAKIFWKALTLAFAGVAASSLAGFMGRTWWVFDLFSHFRVQYFLLSSAAAAVFMAGRKPIRALAGLVLALKNLALILPIYRTAPPHFQAFVPADHGKNISSGNPPVYRLLLANVLQQNRDYARVRELILSSNPDVIFLIEINKTWLEELQPVLARYPYALEPVREDNYGLGLFSKLPFTHAEPVEFGQAEVPSVLARFHLDGQPFTLIGTHPPPPKRSWLARQRNGQLAEVAEFAAGQAGAVMVLGDLNITSWSPYFQDLLRASRLMDSRQGWGLQPSWPVDRPPFRVPIDHVLVSQGIAIHRRRCGPFIGSDHLPILVEFSLCPSPSSK